MLYSFPGRFYNFKKLHSKGSIEIISNFNEYNQLDTFKRTDFLARLTTVTAKKKKKKKKTAVITKEEKRVAILGHTSPDYFSSIAPFDENFRSGISFSQKLLFLCRLL